MCTLINHFFSLWGYTFSISIEERTLLVAILALIGAFYIGNKQMKISKDQVKLSKSQMRLSSSQAKINMLQFNISMQANIFITCSVKADEYIAKKDVTKASEFANIMNNAQEYMDEYKNKLNEEIEEYNRLSNDLD